MKHPHNAGWPESVDQFPINVLRTGPCSGEDDERAVFSWLFLPRTPWRPALLFAGFATGAFASLPRAKSKGQTRAQLHSALRLNRWILGYVYTFSHTRKPLNNETYGQPPDSATLIPPEPALPPTLHKIFIGKDGLRAGWSLLIFIAIFAAIAFCANRIGHKLHPPVANAPTEISPSFGYIAELIPFLITVLVSWIMSKIERRPNSVYGFGDSRMLQHFLAGLAWGVTCLSVLILILWKSGLPEAREPRSLAATSSATVKSGRSGFFLVGLLEEYLTRGWRPVHAQPRARRFLPVGLQDSPQRGLGLLDLGRHPVLALRHGAQKQSWRISSLGFSPPAWRQWSFVGASSRTGSLRWVIGLHTSWDWGQSFLYGVPDSGLMVQHHLLANPPRGASLSSAAGGPLAPKAVSLSLPPWPLSP